MTLNRVTQNMMSHRALDGLQAGLGRLSHIQEQLSTGRIINRPSDDPSGATVGDAAALARGPTSSSTPATPTTASAG